MPKNDGETVLALGNFDGLHLAHREIIARTRQNALKRDGRSVVFLLDPHPVKVLYPDRSFKLLTTLDEKLDKIRCLGIDYAVVESFTENISAMPPFYFAQNYLTRALRASKVIVGFDYTFGRKGKGTVNHLLKWGDDLGFEAESVSPIMYNNYVVSSSLVRELLIKGEVEQATQILGYFYNRTGRVVHGDGRGKKIGFPTANLEIPEGLLLPGRGVYLSLISRGREKKFALTNIGIKPTFCQDRKTTAEVFILDFQGNIYDEELTIYFLHKIRDEQAFENVSQFTKQVELDIQSARELIKNKYHLLLNQGDGIDCCPMFTKLT